MSISKGSPIAGLMLIAALAAPAAAQVQQPMETDPDAEDIARTPLEDLNLQGKDIPEVLIVAETDPYASQGLNTCNAIVGEIAKLDTVLGEDYDITEGTTGGMTVGKAAKGVVGSLIPFRGLVREVSGAAGDERKARAAYTAGMVRRGYLKGLGQSRGCRYPARPKER